jgi:hypothetical protein
MVRGVQFSVALVGAVFSLGIAGCADSGPAVSPVKGTLTIDGQPADNVTITFAPTDAKLPTASGQVKKGAFELVSGVQGKSGAAPGKYKVVLAQSSTMTQEEAAAAYGSGAKGGPPKAPKLSFPEKYTKAETSDKEVEVKSGSNDVKIEISSK